MRQRRKDQTLSPNSFVCAALAGATMCLVVGAFAFAQSQEPVPAPVDQAAPAFDPNAPPPPSPLDEGLDPLAEEPQAPARVLEPGAIAILRGLDKVTGRTTDFRAKLDEPAQFGQLVVRVRACAKHPPEDPPEVYVYAEIDNQPPKRRTETAAPPATQVFRGWMFGSSPGLNGVEHPVYDVWAIDCITS